MGLVESDPAIKILEVAAWRELLLRQRMNEAVKSNLLKFAKGEDLDNLAEFYGVEREKEEEDERFRNPNYGLNKEIKVQLRRGKQGKLEYFSNN